MLFARRRSKSTLLAACLVHLALAQSQLGQDSWVLSKFGGPRFFLDVGANDGVLLSNTYELENAGWTGLCIDPFPQNHQHRRAKVVEAAVAASVRNVTFHRADEVSGIKDYLGTHAELALQGQPVILTTRTLGEILDTENAPSYIDYMSLDTEGSEYDILSTFPFWKYRFGLISVEHNREEPKKTMVRELLDYHGYMLEREVEIDDWFVSKCVASKGEPAIRHRRSALRRGGAVLHI